MYSNAPKFFYTPRNYEPVIRALPAYYGRLQSLDKCTEESKEGSGPEEFSKEAGWVTKHRTVSRRHRVQNRVMHELQVILRYVVTMFLFRKINCLNLKLPNQVSNYSNFTCPDLTTVT